MSKIISWRCLKENSTKSCGCLNIETRSSRQVKPYGTSAFNALYSCYNKNAINRGLLFPITKEEFREITQKNCHYCGLPPSNYFKYNFMYGGYTYNGIDRVDNSVGYVNDNIVPCCKWCNQMKLAYTKEEFLSHISRIYNFLCKKTK